MRDQVYSIKTSQAFPPSFSLSTIAILLSPLSIPLLFLSQFIPLFIYVCLFPPLCSTKATPPLRFHGGNKQHVPNSFPDLFQWLDLDPIQFSTVQECTCTKQEFSSRLSYLKKKTWFCHRLNWATSVICTTISLPTTAEVMPQYAFVCSEHCREAMLLNMVHT